MNSVSSLKDLSFQPSFAIAGWAALAHDWKVHLGSDTYAGIENLLRDPS
jgi:hypothetical protein